MTYESEFASLVVELAALKNMLATTHSRAARESIHNRIDAAYATFNELEAIKRRNK
jgi:hypothetical protein